MNNIAISDFEEANKYIVEIQSVKPIDIESFEAECQSVIDARCSKVKMSTTYVNEDDDLKIRIIIDTSESTNNVLLLLLKIYSIIDKHECVHFNFCIVRVEKHFDIQKQLQPLNIKEILCQL